MTNGSVRRLEREFKLLLPADYKKLLTSFPIPLMRLLSCEANPNARHVYQELTTIVSANQLMRKRQPTDDFVWPEKYFIIGGDPGGNYYCLNLAASTSAIYYWFHETGEFSLYARSLASFIFKVFHDYARNTLDILILE